MQDISYEFEPNTFEKYIPMIDKKIESLENELITKRELGSRNIRDGMRISKEIDKWNKIKRIIAPKSGLVSISMDEDTFSMLESLEYENG